jgi:DNA primase
MPLSSLTEPDGLQGEETAYFWQDLAHFVLDVRNRPAKVMRYMRGQSGRTAAIFADRRANVGLQLKA